MFSTTSEIIYIDYQSIMLMVVLQFRHLWFYQYHVLFSTLAVVSSCPLRPADLSKYSTVDFQLLYPIFTASEVPLFAPKLLFVASPAFKVLPVHLDFWFCTLDQDLLIRSLAHFCCRNDPGIFQPSAGSWLALNVFFMSFNPRMTSTSSPMYHPPRLGSTSAVWKGFLPFSVLVSHPNNIYPISMHSLYSASGAIHCSSTPCSLGLLLSIRSRQTLLAQHRCPSLGAWMVPPLHSHPLRQCCCHRNDH